MLLMLKLIEMVYVSSSKVFDCTICRDKLDDTFFNLFSGTSVESFLILSCMFIV